MLSECESCRVSVDYARNPHNFRDIVLCQKIEFEISPSPCRSPPNCVGRRLLTVTGLPTMLTMTCRSKLK